MGTLATYVPIVHTEAESLAQFLATLSADDWQRPSACKLWAIRDVVAHLIWVAAFYTDTVSRGLQGDLSQPVDRPPGNAPAAPAAMPIYFHQQMLKMRDRVGAQPIPTLQSSFQGFFTVLSGLSLQQWAMPCAFFRRTQPTQAFLLLSIQELVIHGWDIHSRFDATSTLRTESLPPLMERIPQRTGLATFPINADRWPWVRYRFDMEAVGALSYDIIVERGTARMEPAGKELAEVILHCDQATFALMMYKRLTLDPAVAQGRVTIEGDYALVSVLDQWLKQP
jgi:uncharacterized protein (TIGR03083 family)